MTDQSEVYLDHSRSTGKRGKKKRKNKKSRNNGEDFYAVQVSPGQENDMLPEMSLEPEDISNVSSLAECSKESEIPEADRTEEKESETPEAERVEDISPTESVSLDEETEDKENLEVGDVIELDEEDSAPIPKVEREDSKVAEQEQPMDVEDTDEKLVEEDDVNIPINIDEEGRVDLYEKGIKLLKQDKRDAALRCFLRCLTGLKDNSSFQYLPQCLHQIADIYYEKEDYKAIQFIQAEKMYYETALISTSHKQKLVEERRRSLDGDIDDKENVEMDPNILKANEYENLAKMCLEKNQPQIALEYQGKATKIRQQIYGSNHPVTTNSMDTFAVIYAEAGKQFYSESMQKLAEESSMPEDILNQIEVEPASELRNRKMTEAAKEKEIGARDGHRRESPVTQVEELDSVEVIPPNEGISGTLVWVLFFIFTLILSIIVFYLYCRWDVTSKSCIAWKSDLHYYYSKAEHFYLSTFFPDT